MKTSLLATTAFLLSLSSYAQMDYSSDVDVYMQRVLEAHSKSEAVQAIKQKVEAQYDVVCVGGSSGSILPFYFPVTYKAKCSNQDQTIRLKIRSSFKGTEGGKDIFKVRSYKVSY